MTSQRKPRTRRVKSVRSREADRSYQGRPVITVEWKGKKVDVIAGRFALKRKARLADRDGSFEVRFGGRGVGELRWSMAGPHNRMNALATIAAARHVGVPAEQALKALSRFSGDRKSTRLNSSHRT